MYQEWFKEYEKIKNSKNNQEVCPLCGRKLGDDER